MRMQLKTYTEPIVAALAGYRGQLEEHPFLVAGRAGELSGDELREFAFHQYTDSILWIPMLAQMRSKAQRSRRLRKAIGDNIGHEAGLVGESHVTLAVALMRSLGVHELAALPVHVLAQSAELWLGDEFAAMSEAAVAGFLLGAETLVPVMFASVLPSYAKAGADTRYFVEHVGIDTDEHSAWMEESVADVLRTYGPDAAAEIRAGLDDAWSETIDVPETMWRARCASR
ncbi:MAG: iron-containing redox enzyme family protein [Deltaproteobacteria bacterium]|nr:iron-containing redox enzyme family protein [Deltaproteobacteria bacterium]